MQQEKTTSELRALLLSVLALQPQLRRKALIERCVQELGFTPQELLERTTGAPVVRAKSRLGMQLTALLQNGDIDESEAGYLTVRRNAETVLRRESAEKLILAELEKGTALPRRQIYERIGRLLAPTTKQAQAALNTLLGQTISALEREKRVVRTQKGYLCPLCNGYPNTELGNWLAEAKRGGDLQRCFLGAVHTKGGEWLELYAVQLLEKYYTKLGKTVTAAAVTGGSDDGGLDGVVETTDWLGFREVTLLQMKNRLAETCAKDVREFYGAVCAANGTRGIFVTVSQFHEQAQKLLDKVDNLIGIDGRQLFEIAAFCGFGVVEINGARELEDTLFLADK